MKYINFSNTTFAYVSFWKE